MAAGSDLSWQVETDVLVVGTGVAGLTAAHGLSRTGLRVLVVTKSDLTDSSTAWAQGGVAVVTGQDPRDSVADHVVDTLEAGAGLCDRAAVDTVLTQGPAAVARLRARGARFDAGPAGLLLTREGGHHADRVIHAGGDATGAEIERALAAGRGLPPVLTHHLLLDLVQDERGTVCGADLLDDTGRRCRILAGAVVLATGGAGHLYPVTTNPVVATGDGLAAALRAGGTARDLEFVQFHPTALWTGPDHVGQRPLVTEAVRGAGAVLLDATGARVMTGVHPLADLAPRDVVSAAITRRLAQHPGGVGTHVFLDATGIPAEVFRRRFPTVLAACTALGVDPSATPIPVAPAAHYQCGGVATDLDGRTDLPGLFAVGEVARTGLHGANRLASNSLLEGLVLGERVIPAVIAAAGALPPAGELLVRNPVRPAGGRGVRQQLMGRVAGIGRDATGLAQALLPDAAAADGSVETANLALIGRALAAAAGERTESRGCHLRHDHPDRATDPYGVQVRLMAGSPVVARVPQDSTIDDRQRVLA